MQNKEKRIAWLINHTTLMNFEVPLIHSLGFEVFTSKLCPEDDKNFRSGSVDYCFDSTLTLPSDVLNKLNEHNFYIEPITPQVASILNRYFSVVIVAAYPFMAEQVMDKFYGRILLRVFGREFDYSYADLFSYGCGPEFKDKIFLLGERVWFAQCYSEIALNEPYFLQNRSVTLPLGLPPKIWQRADTWTGTQNKLLFFCPSIASSPTYYGEIYKNFKKNFVGIPYTIAGEQPIPVVDDSNVAGFVSSQTIQAWFREYKVMFYHSQEERHLHYHPLEAIVYGMPLIYMKGGLLEKYSRDDQPGACDSFQEAREKIQRILNGDDQFIKEIKAKQHVLVNNFTYDYCHTEWNKHFITTVMQTPVSLSKKRKIAVLLPNLYKGGTLRGAKNIAKMLQLGSRQQGEEVEVVVSCINGAYDIPIDFADLREMGIEIRETNWNIISHHEVRAICPRKHLKFEEYFAPYDDFDNFHDCDFWLLISDRTAKPLAPIRPYGVVIYDYIQRRIPEIFADGERTDRFWNDTFEAGYLGTVRAADFVLTTTPMTRNDAISYAGVSADRVVLTPMEFDHLLQNPSLSAITTDYFCWTTNNTQHKNHVCALNALIIYYEELDGKLEVAMTGENTHYFDFKTTNNTKFISSYIKQIQSQLQQSAVLNKNIHILGNVSVNKYIATLAGAKFLWHPALIDNGTYSVIEAAYYGIPALSHDYPAMRYIDERFNLNLTFADATNPFALAKKLKEMESHHLELSNKLPKQEVLHQFSYQNVAAEFWLLLRDIGI
ncbi:glycosytransferase [soil metagenome]